LHQSQSQCILQFCLWDYPESRLRWAHKLNIARRLCRIKFYKHPMVFFCPCSQSTVWKFRPGAFVRILSVNKFNLLLSYRCSGYLTKNVCKILGSILSALKNKTQVLVNKTGTAKTSPKRYKNLANSQVERIYSSCPFNFAYYAVFKVCSNILLLNPH